MVLRLFSMFTGYGGAEWGLKKAGVNYECIGISEIDKYAEQCFNQNFPGIKNYGDCTKIKTEELPDFDLLTGGFPCQDVSLAGKRDLSKGRTNLYLEILRIAKEKKPKYMLLENVKGLLSMEVDERGMVYKIIADLEAIGYGVCWKVLNSKDFGIPQNRERIWFACKLGGWDYFEFQFPQEKQLKIFLKDILEKEIDKKYYLSEKMIAGIMKSNFNERKPLDFEEPDPKICRTLKIGGDVPCLFALRTRENGLNAEFSDGKISNCLTGSQNLNLLSEKTRDVQAAIDVASDIANREDKPVQIDIMHLKNGEIRPLSTYIPQDLDVHRCLQAGEPKEVLVEPLIIQKHHSEGLRQYKDVCPTIGNDMGGNVIRVAEPVILGGLQKHQTPRNDGISPSLTSAMGMGGGQTPILLEQDVSKKIKQRIGNPNQEDIKGYLTEWKNKKGITIEEIENHFGNQAGHHWFEKGGSVPDVDDWIKLKQLLGFDNTFDELMTTFRWTTEWEMMNEHKGRHQEKGNGFGYQVKKENEISNTITATETGINLVEQEMVIEARGRMKYNELNDCTDVAICLRGDKGKDILVNRIRRLTPKECFRLMGFLNDEINLDGLSDTRRYKLAGNGWDVNLASKILNQFKFEKK